MLGGFNYKVYHDHVSNITPLCHHAGKTGPSESNKFIDVTQKLNLVTKRKNILNGISAYFNPRELIAIMGPSGRSNSCIGHLYFLNYISSI